MNLKEKIGLRIAQLRKSLNLSQQEFANTADLERSFLTHIENGRRNISVDTLEKITSGLGISIQEFFNSKEFSEI